MQLTVKNMEVAKIEWGFEKIKAEISEYKKKFEDLVDITDAQAKDIQVELNTKIKGIEDFRKEIKGTLSEPITKFEKECKELVDILESVKKGFSEKLEIAKEKFDAERKKELDIIKNSILESVKLKEKYLAMIKYDKALFNKNISGKKMKEELEKVILNLEQSQKNEELVENAKVEKLTLVQSFVEDANAQYGLSIPISIFANDLELNALDIKKKLNEIVANKLVEKRAKESTLKPQDAPTFQKVDVPKELDVVPEIKPGIIVEKSIVKLQFEITKQEALKLLEFLKKENIEYKKIEG